MSNLMKKSIVDWEANECLGVQLLHQFLDEADADEARAGEGGRASLDGPFGGDPFGGDPFGGGQTVAKALPQALMRRPS
jgi:hypothetical protein